MGRGPGPLVSSHEVGAVILTEARDDLDTSESAQSTSESVFRKFTEACRDCDSFTLTPSMVQFEILQEHVTVTRACLSETHSGSALRPGGL